ncbi:MAG: hypothetical protein MJA32_14750 [Proteobacteria bacterium]|nr:hypothetical protein [Pseudomonadota bacterium]
MTALAFPDRPRTCQLREDRGDYAVEANACAAAADHAEQLYQAQGLVGQALNLTGLLLAALGDAGDPRAMQVHTAAQVIEKKLQKACKRLDRHEARHTKLFLAHAGLAGE